TGSTGAAVSAVRLEGAGPLGPALGSTSVAAFAGAGCSAGLAGASSSAASIVATTPPSDSVSPTLTLSSLTTPANGDGTSIVALSDSSVTRPWSLATVSPTATSTSITGTSSKPPISGTRASFKSAMPRS